MDRRPPLDYIPAVRTRAGSPTLRVATNVLLTLVVLGVVAVLAVAITFLMFVERAD